MAKVAPIDQRKSNHIRINLEEDVHSDLTTGLEKYHFIHQALPELDLAQINTTISIFGRRLAAPILISSMTGGTEAAGVINQRLAETAQETGLALGVGSQRAALESPEQAPTFSITRKVAPNILLFANLGAIQLNYGYTIDHCRRAVDMIEADALFLHLNPLQEALQVGGDTNWEGLAPKIADICKQLKVPVIAKEVGWGISKNTAKLLVDCGVAAIDVAGAGGTSWSQAEMYRAPDEATRRLAAMFVDWGIPTADSIVNVKCTAPGMPVFASGGLRNGLDIAKCIALGATLCGIAGPFLKAAAVSTETGVSVARLLKQQLVTTMFSAGIADLDSLRHATLQQD